MTSLTQLLGEYRTGLAAYQVTSIDSYYLDPRNDLLEFDGVATSHDEAHLALEEAEKALADKDVQLGTVLVRVSRLYLREVCVG